MVTCQIDTPIGITAIKVVSHSFIFFPPSCAGSYLLSFSDFLDYIVKFPRIPDLFTFLWIIFYSGLTYFVARISCKNLSTIIFLIGNNNCVIYVFQKCMCHCKWNFIFYWCKLLAEHHK